MNRAHAAFVLSFVIPGAGLSFLGRWRYGILNLLGVTAIGILIGYCFPNVFQQYIHYIVLAFATGSAGLAHSFATRAERTVNTNNLGDS